MRAEMCQTRLVSVGLVVVLSFWFRDRRSDGFDAQLAIACEIYG